MNNIAFEEKSDGKAKRALIVLASGMVALALLGIVVSRCGSETNNAKEESELRVVAAGTVAGLHECAGEKDVAVVPAVDETTKVVGEVCLALKKSAFEKIAKSALPKGENRAVVLPVKPDMTKIVSLSDDQREQRTLEPTSERRRP